MKFYSQFLLLVAIFTINKNANADSIVIDWNPSVSPHVIGYAVYFGTTAGNYPYRVSAGDTTSVTISNLVAGGTYYFVATAYNQNGAQSAFSQPLKVVLPGTLSAPAASEVPTTPDTPPAVSLAGNTLARNFPVIYYYYTGLNREFNPSSVSEQRRPSVPSLADTATHVKNATEYAPAVVDKADVATAVASAAQNVAERTAATAGAAVQNALPEPARLTMARSADMVGAALVQFPVAKGHWYEVQASADLENWDSIWQSAVTEADGVMQFADPDAKSFNTRFYRLVSH